MRISICATKPPDVFLVDTNVVSEARKGAKADPGVRFFWKSADPADIYISVLTIGEIRCGLEIIRKRGDAMQASKLEAWLDMIVENYSDRILDFDLDCAQVWGKLMAVCSTPPAACRTGAAMSNANLRARKSPIR